MQIEDTTDGHRVVKADGLAVLYGPTSPAAPVWYRWADQGDDWQPTAFQGADMGADAATAWLEAQGG